MNHLPHIMDWDRLGRKGQRCEILRVYGGHAQVRFADGHTARIDRRALRRATAGELKEEAAQPERQP